MIEFKTTVNEAIDKLYHPITGLKNPRDQKFTKSEKSEINRKYREREKKRLRERYLKSKELK